MSDNLQVSSKIKQQNSSVNILTLSVVRRDGAITPFKSDKISNAIKKAFLAQTKIRNDKNKEKEQQDGIHKTVEALTHKVVSACLLYTSPSPRDLMRSRMPSSA